MSVFTGAFGPRQDPAFSPANPPTQRPFAYTRTSPCNYLPIFTLSALKTNTSCSRGYRFRSEEGKSPPARPCLTSGMDLGLAASYSTLVIRAVDPCTAHRPLNMEIKGHAGSTPTVAIPCPSTYAQSNHRQRTCHNSAAWKYTKNPSPPVYKVTLTTFLQQRSQILF